MAVPRTTLLTLGPAAVLIAACADGGLTLPGTDDAIGERGDGWELAADLDEGPSAGTYPVRAAADDGGLHEAWRDFTLPGEPPSVDHDDAWTLLVTGLAACAGELADVEVDEGLVQFRPDDEARRCQPGDGERTFVFAIDRDAVGDGFVTVSGAGDSVRQFAPESVTTSPTPPIGTGSTGLDPSEVDAVVGDEVAFELVDDDVTSLRGEDLQLLAWDGVQWREVDRPEGLDVAGDPSVEGARVLLPTEELAPASYWVRAFAPGAPPDRVGALLTLRGS